MRAAWRAVCVTEGALWEYTHAQILEAFAKPGFPLELIRQNWGWMDDRELARAAIEHVSPHALEYAPDALRADREMILAAVALDATLAARTGVPFSHVEAVLTTLKGIATREVTKSGLVELPEVVVLKLKHKAARPAGKRMMFGKEVKVAAKKASKVVKAFPAKALKSSI